MPTVIVVLVYACYKCVYLISHVLLINGSGSPSCVYRYNDFIAVVRNAHINDVLS